MVIKASFRLQVKLLGNSIHDGIYNQCRLIFCLLHHKGALNRTYGHNSKRFAYQEEVIAWEVFDCYAQDKIIFTRHVVTLQNLQKTANARPFGSAFTSGGWQGIAVKDL